MQLNDLNQAANGVKRRLMALSLLELKGLGLSFALGRAEREDIADFACDGCGIDFSSPESIKEAWNIEIIPVDAPSYFRCFINV